MKNKCALLNFFMQEKLHPLAFINTCRMFMETKLIMNTVGHAFQQWWYWFFVISCVPDSTLQLKTHEMKSKLKIDSQWWWVCRKIVYCSWKHEKFNGVIMLLVLEINNRHYFQSIFWRSTHDHRHSKVGKTEKNVFEHVTNISQS